MTPAAFARAIVVSKAAMTLIENGTTKTLKHETALAIQRKTGYRAEWVNHGTPPKLVDQPDESRAHSPAEEMMLHLFRGMTREQQRELVLELNATVTANREIQQRFLSTPLRTFGNEDVEAAFGHVPAPPPKPRPQRRRGMAEEDPE